MTAHRSRKKPTRGQIEAENDRLRNALEDIADILEEVGIIDSGDEEPDLLESKCMICGKDAESYFPDTEEAFCEEHYPEDNIIQGEVKIINPEIGIVEPKE